jgi:hypothetical protein
MALDPTYEIVVTPTFVKLASTFAVSITATNPNGTQEQVLSAKNLAPEVRVVDKWLFNNCFRRTSDFSDVGDEGSASAGLFRFAADWGREFA